MDNKKLLFLTGTRADYGKLKPLMKAVEVSAKFECCIFITGMHTLNQYGLTMNEIIREKFKNIHVYMNQVSSDPMDIILANTIYGLSRFISEYKPDLIIVHGDRVEALAGAIVGSLNNILVAHIEGGELSGTIDGIIRHSISKLSHIHFVANGEATMRLKQLGEDPRTIFSIGSPDVDVMLDPSLPAIGEVKKRYNITYSEYSIVLFHPVTTEYDAMQQHASELVTALLNSNLNYVVIYPNNDLGCNYIFEAYEKLKGYNKIKIFPSIRFEYFLTLLKHASFIIGNSSAGMREAPVYGVYTINIGNRQEKRFHHHSIINVDYNIFEIETAISKINSLPKPDPCYVFGNGNSTKLFLKSLIGEVIWETNHQKQFIDIPIIKNQLLLL